MAVIKPVINDFSNGEISPKAFGMVSSSAFASGAEELYNMFPNRMGGATRRGAMEYIATIPDGDTARLIPWSVNDELDFLIVITPGSDDRSTTAGKLRILDISLGATPGFLTDTADAVWEGEVWYNTDDLAAIKYAQSIKQVYLAQSNHKLMSLEYVGEFLNTAGTDDYYSFNLLAVRYIGEYAQSTEIMTVEELSTDPILASYFFSKMLNLVPDTVYNIATNGLSGIINGEAVATIKRTVTTTPRRFVAKYKDWNDLSWTNRDIEDGESPAMTAADKWHVGPKKNQDIFTFTDSATATSILDKCEANGLIPGVFYNLFGKAYGLAADENGTFRYLPASSISTFTITFVDNLVADLVITESSTGLTGWLSLDLPPVTVNNKVVAGQDILDKVGIWMTPNISYSCAPDDTFNEKIPTSAIKQINDDGDVEILVTYAEPYNEDGDTTLTVNSKTEGLTGRLAVDITPYSRSGDNPGFVAFHQGRMVLGGSNLEPNVLHMSQVNDYTNFKYFEDIQYEKTVIQPTTNPEDTTPTYISRADTVQQVTANSAMKFQLATEENESVRWAASVEDMIIGTDTSEWVIPADITALNPRIVLTTRNGSADMQGRFVNGMVVYVPRSRRGARVFSPNLGQMSPDIMEHADHLTKGKQIIQFDFRSDPRNELLMLRDDGVLLVGQMTEGGVGWYRIATRTQDKIESVCGIAAYGEDAVYVVVKRKTTTNDNDDGMGYVRTIERIRTMDDTVFGTQVYLDSYVSLTVTSTITIGRFATSTAGDRPVIVFSTGAWGILAVNSSGAATQYIDSETGILTNLLVGATALVGHPYTSRLKTMRIDSSETEGLPKTGGPMHVRVLESGDIAFRREYDDTNVLISTPLTSLGVRIFPYSGALRFENIAPHAVDQKIILESASYEITEGVWTPGHEPLTIQLVSPEYNVGDAV